MRLDGYVRVSRVGGRSGESFISPDEQRREVASWASRHSHEVIAWHEDLDQSGGTIERPGFQAALARIERGQSDGMIVPRLDRFGRSTPRIYEALERIQRAGGVVVSAAEDFDLSTAGGKAHFNMLALMAQYTRDAATESWDVSNASAIRRGIHFTNSVPFGYVRDDGRRLQPDPTRAPLVVEVFGRRARRESWRRIADWLNEASPRPDGRDWSPRSVAVMVKRRTYLGEAFHGEHRNADAHAPVVTPEEYDAANAVTGGPGPIHENGALLAGLIRCAGCRYAMRRTFTTYRDGRRVQLYSCQVKHTGGKCQAPANVMAHMIEPLVVASFIVTAGPATSWHGQAGDDDALEAARRQEAHAEARRDTFLGSFDELAQRLGHEAVMAEAERRATAVEEARAEREQAERARHIDTRRSHVLGEDWPTWDKARQADLLRTVLDAIYVRKGRAPIEDRALILSEGEDTFEKPRRGTTDYRTRPIDWPREPVPFPDEDSYDTLADADRYRLDHLALRVPGYARRYGFPGAEDTQMVAASLRAHAGVR
jgi:DNA invertase Pin-like site-specific DNA recombinase